MGEFKTTGGNEGARGKYATWWNTKRVKEGVTYKELIELLGDDITYSESYVNYAFIGKIMPKEDLITKVADIFGVSFQEAKSHFFNDWGGNKSKIPVGDMIIAPKVESVKPKEEDNWDSDNKNLVEFCNGNKPMFLDRESILKKVYRIVDFDIYILIDENLLTNSYNSYDDILDSIYGKVSRDVYDTVSRMFIKEA